MSAEGDRLTKKLSEVLKNWSPNNGQQSTAADTTGNTGDGKTETAAPTPAEKEIA